MLCSVSLIFLPFGSVLANKGRGGGDDDDAAVPPTPPTNSSGTADTAVSMTSPASSSGTNTSIPTPGAAGSNGFFTHTAMPPASTTPAPAIHFSMPSNATTCTPVTFRWDVIPPSSNVTEIDVRLLITNDGVQQAPPCPSSAPSDMPHKSQHLPSTVVSHDITNRTSLASGAFNWSAVTVPEGWYILEASPADADRTDIASQSAQFYVDAGSNTTCVNPNISTSAFPASSSHSGLSAGALAGTAVGAVVGIAALLGAFVLPRLWRKGVPGHLAWKGKTGGLYHVF